MLWKSPKGILSPRHRKFRVAVASDVVSSDGWDTVVGTARCVHPLSLL